MKKIYLTAVLFIGLLINTNAQQSFWTVNWDISKAVGDAGNYIEDVNYRGFSFEGRYFINSNITIGGFTGWYTLYEKQADLPPIEIDTFSEQGHISGTQLHYLNIFPILANSHYYIETGNNVTLYTGLGLGGVYVEQRTDLGFRSYYSDNFNFAVQPELGIFIPFGYSGSGLNLAVRYLYGTAAGDLDELSMFNVAIGFGFMND